MDHGGINTFGHCFKVLEFVDLHGTEVLNLGSFTLLPQHVVRLILVREELKADEFTKFQVINILLAYRKAEVNYWTLWNIACTLRLH